MSFLRQRKQTDAKDDDLSRTETYAEREAREEAQHDWRQKSRFEKLKLARVELARRRGRLDGKGIAAASFFRNSNKTSIIIALLAFISLAVLVSLLRHSRHTKLQTVRETYLAPQS